MGRFGAWMLAGVSLAAASAARAEDGAALADAADQPEAIVVTGQRADVAEIGTKTDTPLIETPQAISVISSDRFESMGAINLQDTLRYTPGVRTEAYGLDSRGDYGFIRGTEFPIYQDSLRRTFGFRVGSKPEIFTLERVEVLRGPSSMLYGAGPTGGLINIVTKSPQFDFAGEAFASYGTFDRIEGGFDITGPIAGDTLAGRLIAMYRDSDSQTDFVDERRFVINPSLTFVPGPSTSLTLTGLVQDDDSGWVGQFLPYVGTLWPAPNGKLPWGRQLGEPATDRVNLNTEWIAARFAHRFAPWVEFRQNARYEWFKSDQFLYYADVYGAPTDPYVDPADPYLNLFFPEYAALGPNRVLNRFAFGEVFHSKTLASDSQLQFDFETGDFTHKILAGLDYSRYRARARSAFGFSGPSFDENGDPIAPTATPIDAYNPVYGNLVDLPYFDDPRERQSQTGYYLQSQTRAYDLVTLVLGIRRDRATNATVGGTRLVDTATTKRAGLMVDVADGLVPYFSYSESFLPIAGADFFGEPFRPQRGRQYEAGIKWQPDRGTFVTLAAYDLKDRNRLVADPDNPLNSIQAGVIATRGFEIEAQKTVAQDFDVVASYSYTRAKDRGADDQQVESVPRHLASIWGLKYVPLRPDMTLRLGAGVRYVGESVSTSFDSSFTPFVLKTPDYVLADALVGVDSGPWRLSVNATNLFDKKYYTTCLGRGDCFLGLRRTVNATVGYRF